jgi:hypothetical protein
MKLFKFQLIILDNKIPRDAECEKNIKLHLDRNKPCHQRFRHITGSITTESDDAFVQSGNFGPSK